MAVVLDARVVEVGQVPAVVDDPLRVGVGEANARQAEYLNGGLRSVGRPSSSVVTPRC